MIQYWVYKWGEFIANRLSLAQSYRLARFLTDIQFYCSRVDRKAVIKNLTIILGDEEAAKKEARAMFNYFGMYLVDFFRLSRHIDDYLGRISIEGEEYMREAMASDKGAIVLTAHMGNWELGAAVVSQYFDPLVVIALPHVHKRVNDWFNEQRRSVKVDVVQTTTALRSCLQALSQKRLVAVAADRDFGHHGVAMPFLGREAMFPKGAAVLSLKTGAPIIPGFMHRDGDEKFVMRFTPPIYPPEKMRDVSIDDIKNMMKRYIPIIEEQVYAYPSQWLIFREFAV